jgi:flagellar M-ring protein FliF
VSVILDEGAIRTDDLNTRWIPAISAAAGINTARDGAQALQVSFMPFSDEAKAAATIEPAASGGNAIFDLIKTFLTLVMVGVILFFAWKAIKRAESNRVPLRVPLDMRELEAGLAGLPAGVALAGAGGGGAAAGAPARKPIEAPPITLEGEITDLIERQPDEVAQTLRSWLADRRA